jgi:hypothetical protein
MTRLHRVVAKIPPPPASAGLVSICDMPIPFHHRLPRSKARLAVKIQGTIRPQILTTGYESSVFFIFSPLLIEISFREVRCGGHCITPRVDAGRASARDPANRKQRRTEVAGGGIQLDVAKYHVAHSGSVDQHYAKPSGGGR